MSGSSFRGSAVVGGPAEDISVVAAAALPATSSSSSFSSSSLLLLPPPPPTSAHNFRCCAPPALSAAAWPRFESRLVFGLLHDGATPQCSSRNSHFRLVSPHLRLWDLLLRLVEAFWVILGKNVQHLAIGTSRKSIQLLEKLNWHPLVQQIVTSCCGLPIRSIFNIFCRGLQVWCISVSWNLVSGFLHQTLAQL